MDLRRWNAKHVEAVLGDRNGFAPFPRRGEAGVAAIRAGAGEAALAELFGMARQDVEAPIPALPASLYLEFQRTGRREGYEDAQRLRRSMLYRLTLAEWLAGTGEFVPAIENLMWARLEETNWAWPAHAPGLDFPDWPTVDLAAAMTALDMAESDYLLGDAIGPSLRARIRFEVERRTIAPFLTRHDHWWLHSTPEKQVNNWTAVCVAGIVGAACYLEPDQARLAEIVARGLHSLADYLETFDSQGGSSEGPDYWSYGFGNFVVLAHLLAERSGGRIDLLADKRVGEIARFPLRTVLTQGLWASFSDSDSNPQFHPGLLTYLARKLDLPELTTLGMRNDFRVDHFNQFVWPLRQYAWPLPETAEIFGGTDHDWFADMAWMICRLDPADPGSLRLAVKGGHNEEMHNQNDVGALIVVNRGRVLITDPGRGRYSKAYFGPERYENIMASSRGHSVPVVNGREQAEGRESAARDVHHRRSSDSDMLSFDMTDAYPREAGLAHLKRSIAFDRRAPGGRIHLTDEFAFRDGGGEFQSVLVSPVAVTLGQGEVHIGDGEAGLIVRHDPAEASVSLDHHRGVEKQYAASVDLTRIVFTAVGRPHAGRLELSIEPR